MNPARRKPRRQLLYDDPVDCGIFTASKQRRAVDDTRFVNEVHRTGGQAVGAYGLFVGHGGCSASQLCARNFIPTLLDDEGILRRDPEGAIRKAVNTLEAFVLAKSALDQAYFGTTLLFALVHGSRLHVANVGNSRAILASRDGVHTLTHEHDITNVTEVARVRSAGGYFTEDGKVNELIRVTRSIGDLELKGRKHITFPHIKFSDDVLVANPDIITRRVSPLDDFIVMATPHVWERLSNRSVVQIVRAALRRRESSRTAARRVAAAAIAEGASGPLTVMLLLLPGRSASDSGNGDDVGHSPIERRHTHFSTRPSPGKRLAAGALRARAKWAASNGTKETGTSSGVGGTVGVPTDSGGTSTALPLSAPVSPASSVRRHRKKDPEREKDRGKDHDSQFAARAKIDLPNLITVPTGSDRSHRRASQRPTPPSVQPPPWQVHHIVEKESEHDDVEDIETAVEVVADHKNEGEPCKVSEKTHGEHEHDEDDDDDDDEEDDKTKEKLKEKEDKIDVEDGDVDVSNEVSKKNSTREINQPRERKVLSKLLSDVRMLNSPTGSGRLTHSRSAMTAEQSFSHQHSHQHKSSSTSTSSSSPSRQKHRQYLHQKPQQKHQQKQAILTSARVQSALESSGTECCILDTKSKCVDDVNHHPHSHALAASTNHNNNHPKHGDRRGSNCVVLPSGRRFTAQSSRDDDADLARRGSGAWPMSDLTSSGTATGTGITGAGRPSSSKVSTDDRRVGVDVNGLDYGVCGPSKVRYRDDGTIHHGRLGFFRDLGWGLGRRR